MGRQLDDRAAQEAMWREGGRHTSHREHEEMIAR